MKNCYKVKQRDLDTRKTFQSASILFNCSQILPFGLIKQRKKINTMHMLSNEVLFVCLLHRHACTPVPANDLVQLTGIVYIQVRTSCIVTGMAAK